MSTTVTTDTATTADTSKTRSARTRGLRSLVLVALAALSLMMSQAPAGAVIVDTDRPRLTAQELDYGRNWAFGAPLNGGWLDWDVSGGVVSARLRGGNIYINNASGTCARMRMEGYNTSHVRVTSRNGGTVCASSGRLHSWSVDFSINHRDLVHVHVVLQVQTTSGGYIDVVERGYWMN